MEYDSDASDVSSSGPFSESLYVPTDGCMLSSSGQSWSASPMDDMDDESGTSVCPSEFAVQLPRPDPSC